MSVVDVMKEYEERRGVPQMHYTKGRLGVGPLTADRFLSGSLGGKEKKKTGEGRCSSSWVP